MAAKLEKNKTEISQRIAKIKTFYCNGNNAQFAAKLGIKEQYASNICNGTKSTGTKLLDKILDTFPDVNRAWLFFGEGTMLVSDAAPADPAPAHSAMGSEAEFYKRIVEDKERRIEQLVRENERLRMELEAVKSAASALSARQGAFSGTTVPTET